ncbi:hypothetical protein NUU61_006142 [Penicillium alfredii]|uniref:Uncharacterized protein n=1 Tax=Penicillium alfredii TaxID=1506179 RepID=A0A9W9F0E7_9EURO|nr:uncharacterized protein NUU61_006142 [Penicillium alfredii]KAJ5091272.1 hypothetical protein NUU61_006142 [Penicillium alfredii]
MERQSSQRRRTSLRQSRHAFPITTDRHSYRPWPMLSWSLVACLLIVLAYLFRPPSIPPLGHWVSPASHPHWELHDTIAPRPRIELHPEDHVYRPAHTQYLDWRITSGDRRPDGVLKQVYLINKLFPGPTIEARSGDTLIISVTNALPEEAVALHWHGLHISNAMDGAAGVSQCLIAPGNQFVYNVTIPSHQSGTFWYHAHSGVARADGLYGGLVVHAPASKSAVRGLMSQSRIDSHRFAYDKELLLLIGDWYHRQATDVLAWYILPGSYGNEPVPDSLLINGAGHFDCSMAVPARPVDCINQQLNPSFLDLDRDTTYRIRVVNTGAIAGISLVFEREQLDLIQVDSVDVELSREKGINSIGTLFPGQRMDFVLRPPQGSGKQSSMTVQLDQECFKYINPALTPDQMIPINYETPSLSDAPETYPNVRHHINIEEVPSAASLLQHLPIKAQQTHVVYTKIQKMARNHNVPFGYFNHTTWKPQKDPAVPLVSLPRGKWDENQFAFTTGPESAWVDLVVNNLDEGPHPFHLHGHHFYVLAVHEADVGWGSFNPFVDAVPPGQVPAEAQPDMRSSKNGENHPSIFYPYDLTHAFLRDNVHIPSRGFAVLRFHANNPGVWMFHCHILWHLATGMAMLIDVQGDPTGLAAHDASLFSADGGGSCSVP